MPQNSPEAQLEELWRAYAPAVFRYARRRVLPGDVDEVVAETFMVAWRRRNEVPEFPLPWLLGVARGVSANLLRTARRRDALTDRLAALPAPAAPPEPASEVSAPLQVPWKPSLRTTASCSRCWPGTASAARKPRALWGSAVALWPFGCTACAVASRPSSTAATTTARPHHAAVCLLLLAVPPPPPPADRTAVMTHRSTSQLLTAVRALDPLLDQPTPSDDDLGRARRVLQARLDLAGERTGTGRTRTDAREAVRYGRATPYARPGRRGDGSPRRRRKRHLAGRRRRDTPVGPARPPPPHSSGLLLPLSTPRTRPCSRGST
jgi:hypothetical protein